MKEYSLALLLLLVCILAVSKLMAPSKRDDGIEHFYPSTNQAPTQYTYETVVAKKKCANRPLPQYHDVLYGYTIAIPNPMYAAMAQIVANSDPNSFYGGMYTGAS